MVVPVEKARKQKSKKSGACKPIQERKTFGRDRGNRGFDFPSRRDCAFDVKYIYLRYVFTAVNTNLMCRFLDVFVGEPKIEEDFVTSSISPQRCRLRDLTYSAPIRSAARESWKMCPSLSKHTE